MSRWQYRKYYRDKVIKQLLSQPPHADQHGCSQLQDKQVKSLEFLRLTDLLGGHGQNERPIDEDELEHHVEAAAVVSANTLGGNADMENAARCSQNRKRCRWQPCEKQTREVQTDHCKQLQNAGVQTSTGIQNDMCTQYEDPTQPAQALPSDDHAGDPGGSNQSQMLPERFCIGWHVRTRRWTSAWLMAGYFGRFEYRAVLLPGPWHGGITSFSGTFPFAGCRPPDASADQTFAIFRLPTAIFCDDHYLLVETGCLEASPEK